MTTLQTLSIPTDALTARDRSYRLLLWVTAVGLIARVTLGIRQRTDFMDIDILAGIEIACVGLTLAILVITGRWSLLYRRIAGTSAAILLLYYVLGSISAAWSPYLTFSLFKGVEALSQMLAVLLILSYARSFKSAEKQVLLMACLMILLSIGKQITIIERVGESVSDWHNWHSNAYTAPSAMLACYCLGELMASAGVRRKRLLFGFCFGLFGVVLGTSSGSIIAAMIGVGAAAMISRKPGVLVLCAIVVGLALIFGGSEGIRSVLFPGKTQIEIDTMSGREDLWAAYWEEIQKSIVFGRGFAILSRITSFMYTTNTHNSFIAAMGSIGLVGLFVQLYWMIKMGAEAVRSAVKRYPGSVGCLAALLAGVINSQSCAYLGEGWTEATFTFVAFLGLHILFVWNKGAGRPLEQAASRMAALSGSQRPKRIAAFSGSRMPKWPTGHKIAPQ
jgi:hypothetical protein